MLGCSYLPGRNFFCVLSPVVNIMGSSEDSPLKITMERKSLFKGNLLMDSFCANHDVGVKEIQV